MDAKETLLLLIGRDAKLLFGFTVILIEIVVTDRPIHKLRHGWIIRLHLEIRLNEPQARSEPMRRSAGHAIVGAGEWPWALLNQVALFRIGPVAERGGLRVALRAKTDRGRPTGIHPARIYWFVVFIDNRGGIRRLRHLDLGCIKPLHIVVDVGRGP